MTNANLKSKAVISIDKGVRRPFQEDSAFAIVSAPEVVPAQALIIIADGMGGHERGDVASQLVVDTIWLELADLFEPPKSENVIGGSSSPDQKTWRSYFAQRLHRAIEKTNVVLYELIQERQGRNERFQATSSLVCALIQDDMVVIANVEDCRAYHLHKQQLRLITNNRPIVHDGHLMYGGLRGAPLGWASDVKLNKWTDDQELSHESDMNPFFDVQLNVWEVSLQAGDRLLLCSDGLYWMVDDDEIL